MNQSRTIRLPVHIVKEINVVLRAMRHLESADKRDSTVERIAALIDRPVDDVRRILSLNEHIASLDAPLEIDPNHTIGESSPMKRGMIRNPCCNSARLARW
jgi:RNA polymerase nonessential primary-like sigma factor